MRIESVVRHALGAVVVAAALVACTSGGDATSSSSPTGATVGTDKGAATLAPTTLGGDLTSEADPGETPGPVAATFGSWVIDVAMGDVAQLGDDAKSLLLLRDSFYPAFTPDGSGVWLSRRNWTDARRYGLDGTLTDSIEGAWAVIESANGRSRAYYVRNDNEIESTLVAERDGVSHRLEGSHALPAFSPDGQLLAYYAIGERNVATLDVLDLQSGAVRTLATDVDPCPCDLTPHPEWSPSGAYVAYYDFAGVGGDLLNGAAFVLEVASGERMRVAGSAPGFASPGWIRNVAGDDRLVVDHGIAQTVSTVDPEAGFEVVVYEAGDDRINEVRVVSGRYVQVSSVVPDEDDPRFATRLFDGETGELLGSWDYEGVAAMTPLGPAFAVSSYALDRGDCDGTLVVHTALASPVCLAGIDEVAWSPDGSQLATRARRDDGQHIGVWGPVEGHRELAVVPSSGLLVGWNPQGTHLFVSDISGT